MFLEDKGDPESPGSFRLDILPKHRPPQSRMSDKYSEEVGETMPTKALKRAKTVEGKVPEYRERRVYINVKMFCNITPHLHIGVYNSNVFVAALRLTPTTCSGPVANTSYTNAGAPEFKSRSNHTQSCEVVG